MEVGREVRRAPVPGPLRGADPVLISIGRNGWQDVPDPPPAMTRDGDVWTYRPASHKTEHHGHDRVIFVGPKAQAVLRPYLLRSAESPCFSPSEAVEKLHAKRHSDRVVSLKYGNRPGTNRQRKPKCKPGKS